MSPASELDIPGLTAQLRDAVSRGKLSASAAENIRRWLAEPPYAEYAAQVVEHIQDQRWQKLDDVFWTMIPFGTGGRRGAMYPIGTNAINDRTIGESAQGLADYVRAQHPAGASLACAVAYDTRHRSRHFAELCAEIMAAAGFRVYFLDGFRSTPELSFAVRHCGCACGVMITASHNPPVDNAIKAYWSTGGQLLPPYDAGVIGRVLKTTTITRVHFAEALSRGHVVYCQEEVDRAYQQQVLAQSMPGPRNLKIVYSPMHGVGASSVCPVLAGAGFTEVEVFAAHAEANGGFPNVPGHVANPEDPRTFETIIERARETGADLVLSTDPDADRLGCAAPLTQTKDAPWRTLTGNQIAALLTEYVLAGRRKAGRLSGQNYVVKTLVTTEMVRRIADSYGIRTIGDLQVGFKYIGGAIDEAGPENFVLGVEESHGYLAGTYARDKDAAVAALLTAEMAAQAKAAGRTLHEQLDALYWQHGCHVEMLFSKSLPGSEGMGRMRKLMHALRNDPPRHLGGLGVVRVRDFLSGMALEPGSAAVPFSGPPGDMVIIDLEAEGNYVAVRPSGTEPKIKFYMFAFEPAEQLANLETTKAELGSRLKQIGQELFALAEAV